MYLRKIFRAKLTLASNFCTGDLDLEVLGVRAGPKKVGFLLNLSPPRVYDYLIALRLRIARICVCAR